MTQKQFKEILANAGYKFDYARIAIKLERLAWLEANDSKGYPELEQLFREDARKLHEGIEAAGIYDGFDAMTEKTA